MADQTMLNVSPERLRDLLDDVEADWGFEYAYDDGLRALRELRRIIGGEPHPNVVSDYELTPDIIDEAGPATEQHYRLVKGD